MFEVVLHFKYAEDAVFYTESFPEYWFYGWCSEYRGHRIAGVTVSDLSYREPRY